MRTFILTLAFMLAMALPVFAQNYERITDFHSDITVNSDSSMEVTETIAVYATGEQIHHGIYRDFPTRYKDRLGNNYAVGFKILDVTRGGYPEPYHTQPMDNGTRIYMGSANVILPPGDYTYTLHYVTSRQLGYFNDHDELYWNVTGNGWIFSIDRASATVTLPAGISANQLRTEAYTGAYGSTEKNCSASVDGDARAQFMTTRGLGSAEGLTIVIGFPKGFVHKPTAWQQFTFFLRDNPFYLYSCLVILIVLGYYLTTWAMVGRDLPHGTVVPQWIPPEGLSPAAMRFIRREGYDTKTFTTVVLSLAVKRFISIHEADEGAYMLKALVPVAEAHMRRLLSLMTPGRAYQFAELGGMVGESPETAQQSLTAAAQHGLPVDIAGTTATLKPSTSLGLTKDAAPATPEELELFETLFALFDTFMVENENYTTVQSTGTALRDRLRGVYEGTLFLSNSGFFYAGLIISGLLTIPVLFQLFGRSTFAQADPQSIVMLLVMIAIGGACIAQIIRMAGSGGGLPQLLNFRVFGFLLVNGIFIAIFFSAGGTGEISGNLLQIPLLLLPLVLLVSINTLFYYLLKAPTFSGRRVMDAIEGFRMYLSVAEKERLNLENPPNKTPELFEQFLPYALALDVEQQWAEQFNEVFANLRAQGADYQPTWYYGSHWSSTGGLGSFASSMGSSLSSAISSSATPPGSSSGFSGGGGFGGGGGFSGGGGGGGGGGGW